MTAQRKPRERHYATKAKVKTFVETARELGIKVGGFEVTPNGTIRILNENASREGQKPESAFDKWFTEGN